MSAYASPAEILKERFPGVDEGVLNLPPIRFVWMHTHLKCYLTSAIKRGAKVGRRPPVWVGGYHVPIPVQNQANFSWQTFRFLYFNHRTVWGIVQWQDGRLWICLSGFESLSPSTAKGAVNSFQWTVFSEQCKRVLSGCDWRNPGKFVWIFDQFKVTVHGKSKSLVNQTLGSSYCWKITNKSII